MIDPAAHGPTTSGGFPYSDAASIFRGLASG